MSSIALLFVVVGVLGCVALYWLVSLETANPDVVDRESAVREAREQGGLDGPAGRQSTRPDRRDEDDL